MGKWGPVGACVQYASQSSQPMGDGAGVFIHHLPLVIVGGLLSVGAEQGINSLALPSRRSHEQKWIPVTRESCQAEESRCWLYWKLGQYGKGDGTGQGTSDSGSLPLDA